MAHEPPDEVTNSELSSLIDEYARKPLHKMILYDRWLMGLTFERLAEKYDISVSTAKRIVYKQGDKILLKAK